MIYSYFDSPVGQLLLAGADGHLRILGFSSGRKAQHPDPASQRQDDAFPEVKQQLREYFNGERRSFDLPLEPKGTDFQRQVWNELSKIPYGATRSYEDIARECGDRNKARAVGQANSSNPLAIVVPCHRVIGKQGDLRNYGGGVEAQQFLLDLEHRISGHKPAP